MAFAWTEESIRWFLDASAYTGFHAALADKLLPHLGGVNTLLDVGCGLGRVDLELAPHLGELTAVDIDERVIALLGEEANRRGLAGLRAVCGDAGEIARPFDAILMTFFGTSVWLLDRFLPQCKRLIRVVNSENTGHLYPLKYRRDKRGTARAATQDLQDRGLPYRREEWVLEFGQPLSSEEDGVRFVLHHAPAATRAEVDAFLREHAISTGRTDFPLYLPNQKRLSVFILENSAGASGPEAP